MRTRIQPALRQPHPHAQKKTQTSEAGQLWLSNSNAQRTNPRRQPNQSRYAPPSGRFSASFFGAAALVAFAAWVLAATQPSRTNKHRLSSECRVHLMTKVAKRRTKPFLLSTRETKGTTCSTSIKPQTSHTRTNKPAHNEVCLPTAATSTCVATSCVSCFVTSSNTSVKIVRTSSVRVASSSSGWGADPVPRSGSGSCTRTEYIGAARAQASRILVKEKSASTAWWDCVLLARPALLFSADHHTHLGLRLCGLCVAVSVKLGVRWHLCLLRFAGVRELLPLFFCFICLLFHDGVAQPRGQLFLSGARSFCGGKPRPGDAVTRQGQCGERAARAPTQHATS